MWSEPGMPLDVLQTNMTLVRHVWDSHDALNCSWVSMCTCTVYLSSFYKSKLVVDELRKKEGTSNRIGQRGWFFLNNLPF